ncbi:zinc transporter ZIP9 [Brienomyrus brachyistius]|uniref:zinc transporter ZIP9 n=1 Tax=Brienomyrus brachyistius TaxID=42636 RepID=UPI0020B18B69|nr:zinc transporter ZIP9 [Brienomyrus brachyistius]XP_048862811.1 zinc transporter ZIP9 [Brienomyrus brachyistius]XP_048862813.1 zinc transporter ZIP9 [Brienomyrus brachyistius]
MDGSAAIILISAAMFIGCFLLGLIPLMIKLSEQKLQLVSLLGAGLLCGTALAVIIPEGVELLQDAWRGSAPLCIKTALNDSSSGPLLSGEPNAKRGVPPPIFIGVSLVVGFCLMFVVDQIGTYCSTHDPRTGMTSSTSITATLGLVIHAAADGVALGAAVASSQVSVQVIIFFAVILHKAPAAFGLVSFLVHAGLEKRRIQMHLLVFSVAAPLLAISTYFILSATGGSLQNRLIATGIGMLFSAGTFLYVATVHVLPEISSRGQHHHHTVTYQQGGLGVLESLTLLTGAGLPVLLALGLHDS